MHAKRPYRHIGVWWVMEMPNIPDVLKVSSKWQAWYRRITWNLTPSALCTESLCMPSIKYCSGQDKILKSGFVGQKCVKGRLLHSFSSWTCCIIFTAQFGINYPHLFFCWNFIWHSKETSAPYQQESSWQGILWWRWQLCTSIGTPMGKKSGENMPTNDENCWLFTLE